MLHNIPRHFEILPKDFIKLHFITKVEWAKLIERYSFCLVVIV